MVAAWRGAVVGAVAAASALAVAELLAGVSDAVPSLVGSVGALFVPLVPPALESWAIALFGTSDKAVLEGVVVVVTLAVGAWAGRRAASRLSAGLAVAAVLAVLGGLAMLADPLAAPAPTILALIVALLVGAAVLRWGLRLAATTSPAVEDLSRRRFLVAVAGVGAAAAVTAWTGRRLLRGPPVDLDALTLPTPVRTAPPPGPGGAFDVAGLTPVVVPNGRFYRIDVNLIVPRIDPETWRLRIHGMVERELELTYDEVLALPLVEEYVTLACVSNEVGGDLVGNARWLGTPLGALLDRAGVDADASQVVGRAFDGWTAGFPTPLAYDRPALLAVGMNGEPLPPDHGFPARLVVPGLYGYVSATKWITEIELTTWDAFDGYWIPRGWAKEGPIKTQSRIDVPRRGTTVAAGAVVVAGVAWSPAHGITAVEVQVDDGDWLPCDLTEPLSDHAWRQWRRMVELPAGDHVLRVRATDGRGRVQTSRYAPPRPDGATGHDAIRVRAAAQDV